MKAPGREERESGNSRLLKCKTELVADKMKIMLKQISGANNHDLIFHNSFLIFAQIVPPKIPAPGWENEHLEGKKEKNGVKANFALVF